MATANDFFNYYATFNRAFVEKSCKYYDKFYVNLEHSTINTNMDNYKKHKRLIESLENEYFFYSHNLNGEYLYMSPSVEKILGYPVDEAIKGIVRHMTDCKLNKKTIKTLQESANGKKQNTFELELYTKNREKKVIEITESPLCDEAGNLISIDGVAHDITQRKQNEKLIKKQNKKLKKQKHKLKDTILNLKNTQTQLIQSEKMGALGHLIAGIAHEINTPIGAINASIDNITASLDSAIHKLYSIITELAKPELMVFLRIMNLIDDNTISLTSREKREHKRAIRTRLNQAGIENSISIAELLIYLNLNEQIEEIIPMLKETEDPEFVLKSIKDIYSVRKNSENIKLAVEKASTIVFALRKFTHKDQGSEKEKANLIDNIETVLVLQHNRLKQGIEVIRNFDEIPLVSCYPDELVQVWTNLISNAIQAMNNHGILTIGIKNLDKNIKISITDTGTGIPEENRQKIFEPFFTTKKAGEGTGIGLDIVSKIIEKHKAKLDLESEVGKGTTFTITLPVN